MKSLEEELSTRESSLVYASKYEEFLDTWLKEAVKEYSQYSDADHAFYNVGSNLIYLLLNNYTTPELLERDYKTERIKLIETYNTLTKYVEEIKNTTSKEILATNKYQFIRSMDKFLDGILDSTDTKDIILGGVSSEEYILYLSLSHDCIAKAYDIVNNEVLMLGDYNEE